jgi:hypothetical protein
LRWWRDGLEDVGPIVAIDLIDLRHDAQLAARIGAIAVGPFLRETRPRTARSSPLRNCGRRESGWTQSD